MQFMEENLSDMPYKSKNYFLSLQGNTCPSLFVNFNELTLSRKQRQCLKNDDFDIQDKLYMQMNLAEQSCLRHSTGTILN